MIAMLAAGRGGGHKGPIQQSLSPRAEHETVDGREIGTHSRLSHWPLEKEEQ